MLKDLRHALRMLAQTRSWTLVILLSLGLGIGATTALFSAVNGLLLQTVGVPDPDTLVRLSFAGDNDMRRSSSDYGFSRPHEGRNVRVTVSYAVYQALRAANQTLTDLSAGAPAGGFNVVVDGEADIASGFIASGNYFTVLGLQATTGRLLAEADDRPGAPPVAVISHAFWHRRFAADPNVAGRLVTVNNLPVTIVGVTPPDFHGVQRLGATAPEVTVPLVLDSQLALGQTRLSEPTFWFLQVLGRLRPGVTHEQVKGNLDGVFQQAARAGMDAYTSSLTAEQRALSTNRRGSAVPSMVVGAGRRGIYDLDNTSARTASILGVVVVLVLLIVCANVTNLLLSRATSRRKEISIRLSMGATRGRLMRQLLTESLVLSGIGGLLGLAVAYWSRALLPIGQSAPLDWRVFAFAAAVSTLTGMAFGLVPAVRATRVDLAGVMKDTSRSVTGARSWFGKALLVLEVALALVLVVGAGLFLQTLNNLRRVDVGFDPRSLLMFSVNPQLNRYDADRTAGLYQELQQALAAVPGVRSVALTRVMLLSGSTSTTSTYVEGRTEDTDVHVMTVSPQFFETMGIPVVLGRPFTGRDTRAAPRVVVINETAARTLFGPDHPVGRRIGGSIERSGETEIIGVIRDTKYSSLRDAAPPTVYRNSLQEPVRGMSFVLRTGSDPNAMIDLVRAAIRRVDPNLPLTNVITQSESIERRFAQERLFANAYTLFGVLALLLACIGLFGLMSYSVARRSQEIGIRMALGARPATIAAMVLRESLLLVGIGVALGLASALVAGRFVAAVLFGIAPTDPATIVAATAIIVAVSAVAVVRPVRRASRVDPLIALQTE
jgi:predicted permease